MLNSGFHGGIKQEQLQATLSRHHDPSTYDGFIVEVDAHKQKAIVAVAGAEPSGSENTNIVQVVTAPGKEFVQRFKTSVGSNFTLYSAKLLQSSAGSTFIPVTGTPVTVILSKGFTESKIISYNTINNSGSNEDKSVIYIENKPDQPARIAFLTGASNEINFTGSESFPGYKFAPVSQNPRGAHIFSTTHDKYRLLLDNVSNITPELIKEAQKVSNPAGYGIWVNDGESGNLATFGDEVHNLAKDVSSSSMGSNEPQIKSLKKVTKKLAEQNKVSVKEPSVKVVHGIVSNSVSASTESGVDTKNYQIPMFVTTLANSELKDWKSGKHFGFIKSSTYSDSFFENKESKNSNLLDELNNSSDNTFQIEKKLSASFCAAFTNLLDPFSTSFTQSLNFVFDDIQQPASSNSSKSSNSLASLIAVLRLSILQNSHSNLLREYLANKAITVYTYSEEDNKTNVIAIPNMFGFLEDSLTNNSLFSSTQKTKYAQYLLDYSTLSEDYSEYGGLISHNINYLRLIKSSKWENNDYALSNVISTGQVSNNNYASKINFRSSNTADAALSRADIDSWLFGVWSAQVRTLAQEIINLYSEFKRLTVNKNGLKNMLVLKDSRTVTLVDDIGIKKEIYVRPWDSAFVVFVMLSLFNGEMGQELANSFIASLSDVTAVTDENIQKIIEPYSKHYDYPTVDTVWNSTLLERTRFVLNLLSRNRMIVRG
jgi:hypothetical protein